MQQIGPNSANIAELNYSKIGGAVNGFWVCPETVLTFLKKECSPISMFSAVGNVISYSGIAARYADAKLADWPPSQIKLSSSPDIIQPSDWHGVRSGE